MSKIMATVTELPSVDNDAPKKAPPKEAVLLADQAAEMIRSLISEGALGPGDRVNELELSQKLGISRGPVREAVRRLASTGLLEQEPNSGSRVISPDRDFIWELFTVRESLESLAARLAAERMTDEERKELTDVLAYHETLMAENQSPAYSHGGTDWDFHLLILKGSRNKLVWRICGNDLRDLFSLLRAQHGIHSEDRAGRALQEHRWIVEAITAGNADLATLLMAQHIRASRDNLLSAMPGTWPLGTESKADH
ncbi:MAG: GntR family transcriptional regulator [Rhodospirillales bacterium]|nr:GntR family transcriptional regulator [Rhodospirillales bacterium]